MGGRDFESAEWSDETAASQSLNNFRHFSPINSFSNRRISIDGNSFEYKESASECIGRGSYGCVFHGTCNTTQKPVAVKKMAKMNVKPNELKVMKSVKSDFLVGLIDVCVDDITDSMYIIMELCNIDLDRHLKNHTIDGSLSSQNLRLLIDNVARGYNALHECCIVHRDIKPQNILIKYGPYGHNFEAAKISDFGISRILSDEENEALSNVAGTLYFMAPEVGANILRKCEYGHEVDMWSLGCVFYQCVAGQVPFSERELCRMFLFAACDNFEAYDKPELPTGAEEDVVRLINGCLEIDCTKRITPHQLYNEICKWTGDSRWSYCSDTSSCRSMSDATDAELTVSGINNLDLAID